MAKANTIKGKIQQVERELCNVNRSILEQNKALDSITKQTVPEYKDIADISNEELANFILSDGILEADYDLVIYCKTERLETEEEFQKRESAIKIDIEQLEELKKELQEELKELKSLKEKEYNDYKNPEYIEYLRLKNKFENN